MSRADRDECAAGGLGPFRALEVSLKNSVIAWTGMVGDSRPVAMFGVTPLDILGGMGSPWLLGTDEVRKYAKTFLRFNREYLPVMLDLFPRLVNYVDIRHEVSIRWLKHLGFTFDPDPVPYGPFGMDFYRFSLER